MTTTSANAALHAWVGKTPADWRKDWLKWSVSLSIERPTDEEMERLPYIANEDITSWTGKLLNPDPQPVGADSRRFRRDDVLFNKLRPYLAKVYHAEFDGLSSGELLCLRHSPSVLPRFLFYVVSSKAFVDAINAETFGSKMPRADWDIVGHQPLPLPPLDTQKRIAAFLDEKTARIDALIEKKRALLERLAEQRQAIITQAVTKGLDPSAPMKPSGIDWLGDIPAHWEVLPLRRIARSVMTGRTPPSAAGDYFADGVVPWFTPGDFGERFELKFAEKSLIDEAFTDGVALKIPRFSVLLVGIGATLGKVAQTTVDCSSNQQINAIDLYMENHPSYLTFFLHAFRAEVRVMASGNTLPILNQDKIKSLLIARPPPMEQSRIVSWIEAKTIYIDAVEKAIRDSIELWNERRLTLIVTVITGRMEI